VASSVYLLRVLGINFKLLIFFQQHSLATHMQSIQNRYRNGLRVQ
jgi:hypothetical protein